MWAVQIEGNTDVRVSRVNSIDIVVYRTEGVAQTSSQVVGNAETQVGSMKTWGSVERSG